MKLIEQLQALELDGRVMSINYCPWSTKGIEVHVQYGTMIDLFPEHKRRERKYSELDELYVELDGVKVFALLQKED